MDGRNSMSARSSAHSHSRQPSADAAMEQLTPSRMQRSSEASWFLRHDLQQQQRRQAQGHKFRQGVSPGQADGRAKSLVAFGGRSSPGPTASSNLDNRVSDLEANVSALATAHESKLKVLQDRVASLRAAVRSDIAAVSQDTHAALEDALQAVDSKILAAKNDVADAEIRAADVVDRKLENLQEKFEQTLSSYEAQLLEDFQQLFWKIQQDTFTEVDARIARAMKLFDQDHSKQVGFEFDRMDFKIKGMSATATGSRSGGAGARCFNYVTSMFIVGLMTLVELLTYLSMPFTAIARCCREKGCCKKRRTAASVVRTAATVQLAANRMRQGLKKNNTHRRGSRSGVQPGRTQIGKRSSWTPGKQQQLQPFAGKKVYS